MPRRKKAKINATGRNDRTDRFARFPHRLLKSQAFRSLSLVARALTLELIMIDNGRNNGSLHLSIRDATDRLGMSDMKAIQRGFNELVACGLVVCSKEAHFKIKAAEQSRARCWRLTWLPVGNRRATNEWQAYRPQPGTKANARCEKGMKALKRYYKQLTSHRLPVEESSTTEPSSLSSSKSAGEDSSTAKSKKPGKPPSCVGEDSSTHAAGTITRTYSEWWRDRIYPIFEEVREAKIANER